MQKVCLKLHSYMVYMFIVFIYIRVFQKSSSPRNIPSSLFCQILQNRSFREDQFCVKALFTGKYPFSHIIFTSHLFAMILLNPAGNPWGVPVWQPWTLDLWTDAHWWLQMNDPPARASCMINGPHPFVGPALCGQTAISFNQKNQGTKKHHQKKLDPLISVVTRVVSV